MMNFFRKYMKPILIVTGIGLVIGTFAMYGTNYFFGSQDAIASVNGKKIPLQKYYRTLSQTLQNYRDKEGKDPDENTMRKIKEDIVRDFIQEELFYQEAKKFGIEVSKQEIIATIQSYNIFHVEKRFNPNQYYMVLRTMLRMTPVEFEEETKIRIINNKLRSFIVSSAKVTEKEVMDEYARVNKNDMKNFEKEKIEFTNKYNNEKKYYVLNTWFQQVGEKAKIKTFLDRIEKAES